MHASSIFIKEEQSRQRLAPRPHLLSCSSVVAFSNFVSAVKELALLACVSIHNVLLSLITEMCLDCFSQIKLAGVIKELPLIFIDVCGNYVLVALAPAMCSRPFLINRFCQDSGEPLPTDRFLVHLDTLYYPQSPGMNGRGPHFALIVLSTPHSATESSDPTSLWETVPLVPLCHKLHRAELTVIQCQPLDTTDLDTR